MKKAVKVIGLFALTLCLGVALMACGGKETGKYTYSMSEGGMSMEMTIELQSDNKYAITMTMGDESEEIDKGTYEISGKTIKFTSEDGEVTEGSYKKGKSITMSEGGVSVTYKK